MDEPLQNNLGTEKAQARTSAADGRLPAILLALTVVTGVVDAVSFLALGHVFTANMTGNIVFLAFAVAGAPNLSAPRSVVALVAFFIGGVLGGRLAVRMSAQAKRRWTSIAFGIEAALLLLAMLVLVASQTSDELDSTVAYGVIILTAVAMGIRNATVRKLAVPDLTTTVLTLTISALAADSSVAGGSNTRWVRRAASVVCMFVGAAAGTLLLRHSVALTLGISALMAGGCSMAVLAISREG